MTLVLLLIGGLAFVAVLVFIVFAGVLKIDGDQNKAEKNSAAILDAAFDGRTNVTFKPHMRTLKYETVILGAKERGYALTHQTDNQYGPETLMFEKLSEA